MLNMFQSQLYRAELSIQGPIHYSNVSLIDPVTKAAVRVSRRYLEDGTKVQLHPQAPMSLCSLHYLRPSSLSQSSRLCATCALDGKVHPLPLFALAWLVQFKKRSAALALIAL